MSFKSFLKKYKAATIILFTVAIAILVISFTQKEDPVQSIETESATISNLSRIIGETGKIKANEEVSLSFDTSGLINQIFVNEGDRVNQGQTLINLQADRLNADLSGALASVEAARAKLEELRSGTREVETLTAQAQISTARTNLLQVEENLQKTINQQQLLVEQAEKNLYTTDLRAYLTDGSQEDSNFNFIPPTISGIYNSFENGEYIIELYPSASSSGYSMRYSGLETGTAPVSTNGPIAIGSKGLFIQFPDNFARTFRLQWTVPIPNTRSSNYQNLVNSLDTARKNQEITVEQARQAVESAKRNLESAEAQLAQSTAPVRPERIRAQEAVVRQAQASASSIQALRNQTVIKAPFNGIVTEINANRGERIVLGTPIISLISDAKFEITVNVAEADIQDLSLGDPAKISFDAYRNETFDATVTFIAPTATTINNVTSFKTTLQFNNQNEKIRAGLSANVDIIADTRQDVLTIPLRAVFQDENGNSVVRVIKDQQIIRVKVETGLRGSDGRIEIISGLDEGDRVITFLDENTRKIVESKEIIQ